MKLAIGAFLIASVLPQFSHAQTTESASATGTNAPGYTVFNATPEQEAALRAQIGLMHPDVLPLRVFFVPHWKYLAAARDFHLRVPTGYCSLMFTHLPSRTVFIDNDRYRDEEWLGHWIAHELGHLDKNSANEEDAEKAARRFRRRLEDAAKGPLSSNSSHRGSQKAKLLMQARPVQLNRPISA